MTTVEEARHPEPRGGLARFAPALAISLLAWGVIAILSLAGAITSTVVDTLDGVARTLLVGVGGIGIMRWRVIGERSLLVVGTLLLVGGFLLPEQLFHGLPDATLAGIAVGFAVLALIRLARPAATAEAFFLLLAALAQASAAEAMVPGAASLFTVIGVLFAADGLSRGLRGAFREQGNELAAARADEAAARAAREEREHDIRSALMAIDGAARTLERYHDRLDDENRTMLANALSSEVGRLQKLIVDVPAEGAEPFPVGAVLEPVVALARTEGVTVKLATASGLHAMGRPEHTAQIVRTLLDNARLHAAGTPVRVMVSSVDDFVLVAVEDRGPGVPADEADAIFERGRRGRAAEPGTGQGLGLHSAARLAAAQGGALWVEETKSGGARFVLRLQRAAA